MSELQLMKSRLNERATECETLSSELIEAKTQLDSLTATYENVGNDFQNLRDQLAIETEKVIFFFCVSIQIAAPFSFS